MALTNVKRTFLIYPKGGDKDYTYTSYVSLYARIDDSNIIDSQVVYAEIKIFVYNYIHKAYYYYQGRCEILDDPFIHITLLFVLVSLEFKLAW